jgi:hypothetical protein
MNCALTQYCLPCGRHSEMPCLLNEWWEHTSSCVPTIFVLALTCVTFTDSLWETDKWPTFVQVHRSHNTINIRDLQPFHIYTSLRNADLQITVLLLLRESLIFEPDSNEISNLIIPWNSKGSYKNFYMKIHSTPWTNTLNSRKTKYRIWWDTRTFSRPIPFYLQFHITHSFNI